MVVTATNDVDRDLELRIERIVSGGDGLARRTDGCVVFVPRTAPGDVVEVEYTEQHRQWQRARLTRVVEPGPARRDPPCEVYERCGGCQLQHLHYDAQLAAKASIVIDCLRRLGGVEIAELKVEPSPKEFGYRNRVSLIARPSGAGYHAVDNPDELVDITACPLAEDAINNAWPAVRTALAYDGRTGEGELRLTLRASLEGRVALAIEGGTPGGELAARLEAIEALAAVWWLDARGRVVSGAGVEQLSERWGAHEIPLTGNAFVQVNRQAARNLDAYVIEQCGNTAGLSVIDAYCGFGLRALEIAQAGAVVTAIDIDRASIAEATRLAAEAGVAARFKSAAVERALPSQLPTDIVILNPPRRGAHRRVIEAIAKRPPERVVYVSCDAATLARDIKALGSGFRVSACRAFDLFPQTAHVETVATLTRSAQ